MHHSCRNRYALTAPTHPKDRSRRFAKKTWIGDSFNPTKTHSTRMRSSSRRVQTLVWKTALVQLRETTSVDVPRTKGGPSVRDAVDGHRFSGDSMVHRRRRVASRGIQCRGRGCHRHESVTIAVVNFLYRRRGWSSERTVCPKIFGRSCSRCRQRSVPVTDLCVLLRPAVVDEGRPARANLG